MAMFVITTYWYMLMFCCVSVISVYLSPIDIVCTFYPPSVVHTMLEKSLKKVYYYKLKTLESSWIAVEGTWKFVKSPQILTICLWRMHLLVIILTTFSVLITNNYMSVNQKRVLITSVCQLLSWQYWSIHLCFLTKSCCSYSFTKSFISGR